MIPLLNSYKFGPESSYDPDAQAMFDARAAVGDEPTEPYKIAISNYVTAIKAVSGLWAAIIQLVVIAGATTVAGAVRAIKGSDLTAFNFVNADIGIKTGAKGNGSNKYFNSNYSGSPAGTGQDNFHMYARLTEINTTSAVGARTIFGNGDNTGTGRRVVAHDAGGSNNTPFRMNGGAAFTVTGRVTGNHGLSRSVSSEFTSLIGSTTRVHTDTSVAPNSGSYLILARGPISGSTPVASSYANARILVWALGSAVTLADYSTPTDDLITALNAI